MLPFSDAPMHPMICLSRALRYTWARVPTRSPSSSCHARQTHSVTAQSSYITKSTEKDPYQYQVGFGNRFASEAVCVSLSHASQLLKVLLNDRRHRPGALPDAQNCPQKVKYGLYIEAVRNPLSMNSRYHANGTQMTGSSFTAPRAESKTACVGRHDVYL